MADEIQVYGVQDTYLSLSLINIFVDGMWNDCLDAYVNGIC